MGFLGSDHPIRVVTALLVALTLLCEGLVYPKWVVTSPRGRSPSTKGGNQLKKLPEKSDNVILTPCCVCKISWPKIHPRMVLR